MSSAKISAIYSRDECVKVSFIFIMYGLLQELINWLLIYDAAFQCKIQEGIIPSTHCLQYCWFV